MGDKEETGIKDAPLWHQDMVFQQYKREVCLWRLGTSVKPEKQAPFITSKGLKGDRRAKALQWCLDNPSKASHKNGVEFLLEFLQDEIEGNRRDVRLDLIQKLMKISRYDSEMPATYLTRVEELVGRLRASGFEVNPNIDAKEPVLGSEVTEPLFRKVVTSAGTTYEQAKDDFVIANNGFDSQDIIDRMSLCYKYEKLWQELIYTIVFNGARLTATDQKTINSKLNDDEITYDNLKHEIKRMYPAQIEEKVNKRTPYRAFVANDLQEPSVDILDNINEHDDLDFVFDETKSVASDDSFYLEPNSIEGCDSAFMAKYNVKYDNKKGVFRCKPNRGGKSNPKGGKGKGKGTGKKGNPVNKETGKPMTCHKCGSTTHLLNGCPKNKKPFKKKENANIAEDKKDNHGNPL